MEKRVLELCVCVCETYMNEWKADGEREKEERLGKLEKDWKEFVRRSYMTIYISIFKCIIDYYIIFIKYLLNKNKYGLGSLYNPPLSLFKQLVDLVMQLWVFFHLCIYACVVTYNDIEFDNFNIQFLLSLFYFNGFYENVLNMF